ncbi:peptidase C39 family protein [Candidatus Woesearchaeota archaeon]|nr:peptidase C39 family protein [Candidatus Woesearchaeota archaeon]
MELYKQTTDYTCAACSLMMILNHFNPDFKLNRENEFKVWRETVNLPTRAPSIYGMACFAKKLGLDVRIILEEREYDYPDYRFKGYTKKEIDDAKYMSRIFAKELFSLEISLEERELKLEEILAFLNNGKILLLRVNAGSLRDTRSTSKYLPFFKRQGSELITVLDPMKGEILIDQKALEESFDTLQTKKKRDHRVLIFN